MVQIKCLSNGLYSLKNSHIPFGMGFQPPPPYGGFPFEQHFSYKGASLTSPSADHSLHPANQRESIPPEIGVISVFTEFVL